jgi:long-subunit fatty acid transport protein
MKKYIFSAVVLFSCAFVSAQNINDVLRYSTENNSGSARFQGMSGAFGALGGDMSAININPAGSAVFNNGYVTITASNFNMKNTTSYFNGVSNTNDDNIQLNQVGAAMVFNNANPDADWKKVTFGINYELVNNLDNQFLAFGSSTQGIDGYFLNHATGVPFGDLLIQPAENIEDAYLNIGRDLGYSPQQAFLGYFGGIIDPVDENDDNNTQYVPTGDYSSVNQEYTLNSTGYNTKFTFNLATQYQDNLYLGASLNFHAINYEQLTQFNEDGYNSGSALQDMYFDNWLFTQGSGFSFNVGAIAKLNESLRVGASYQSPTWYTLEDEVSQEINSNLADSEIDFINFSLVTLYPEYKIQTPGKLTGSAALIFGKQGLISFDYSYQDMSKAELRPTSDPSFTAENNFIAQQLKPVNSYRIGGEYRVNQWSLRGGYKYEDSPYENETTVGDLTGFSLGLGYTFGATRLDFSFSQTERSYNHLLFETGLPTAAVIDNTNTQVAISLSFNL